LDVIAHALDHAIDDVQESVAQFLDELRLLVGVHSIIVQFPEPLLAPVVIVREELVLVIVLERNQGLLDASEAKHVDPV